MTKYLVQNGHQFLNVPIKAVHVGNMYNYFKTTDQTTDFLVGNQITRITRKAKYQLFYLKEGGILLNHNKFTGLWEVRSNPWTYNYVEYERKPGNEKDVRIRIEFETGEQLVFHDSRTLGDVNFYPNDDPREIQKLRRQGPDVLHTGTLDEHFLDEWTEEAFVDLLKRSRIAIKAFLLDQSRQAGPGNIYVCEALWEVGMDPRMPSRDVVPYAPQIMSAMRTRMLESIISKIDYLNVLKVFKVRNRPMVCPRCTKEVQRMVQQNRGTYWCPGCQTIGQVQVPPPTSEQVLEEWLSRQGTATQLVAGTFN